jgi:hypothetical protein
MRSRSVHEDDRVSWNSIACRCHGVVTAKLDSNQCLPMEATVTNHHACSGQSSAKAQEPSSSVHAVEDSMNNTIATGLPKTNGSVFVINKTGHKGHRESWNLGGVDNSWLS